MAGFKGNDIDALNDGNTIKTNGSQKTQIVNSEAENIMIESNDGGGIPVTNTNQEQFLSDILKELKIMNLHLSKLTDNIITNMEI